LFYILPIKFFDKLPIFLNLSNRGLNNNLQVDFNKNIILYKLLRIL